MSKFKVGDKVRYTGAKHDIHPQWFPIVGTIGTVLQDVDEVDCYIQWSKGSTSENDCWYCDKQNIELVKDADMTNEEIWEMLRPKMEKNGLEQYGATFPAVVNINGRAEWTTYSIYFKEAVHNAIAIAYRSGYERAMKGRPFKIGEKKKKGGHWEPIDPNNLPKEGTKVRYNGGLKGCNWKKNSEAKWIKTENDRFSIKFDEMIWTLDYMNRLLKYFDVWVEDDE